MKKELVVLLGLSAIIFLCGCVGENKESSSIASSVYGIPIKTTLEEYEISFNSTNKYNYEIKPQTSDKTPGMSYSNIPAYNWYTRKIEVQADMVRGITVSIKVYDEPMNTSMEALEKWERMIAGKHVPTFSTYTVDRTYLIKEEGIELSASGWFDEKTLLYVGTLKFNREDFFDILKSLKMNKV